MALFESEFGYEETIDQKNAIKRIKEAFYLLSEKYDNICMKNESSERIICIKINKEN